MPPKAAFNKKGRPPPNAAVAAAASKASHEQQAAAAGVPVQRFLPAKDAALFKTVLQLYEQRQYTKGLQTAEQILRKYPDHGETLAMKGLFVTCLAAAGNSEADAEQGHELIQQGVQRDPTSHIVWHVYGLMHRANKDWTDALKCYIQAARIEKEQLNIVSELANFAVHTRHMPLFVDARRAILKVAPRLRRNWVNLALAYHLNGDLSQASELLDTYESMLRDVPAQEYEMSELRMWRVQLWDELGQHEHALEQMGSWNPGDVLDRTGYQAARAEILLKLGRNESAAWAYEVLLEANPDNHAYVKAYAAAQGSPLDKVGESEEARKKAVDTLRTMADKYPRSLAIRRLALNVSQGDEFREAVGAYLQRALHKGVPSLFTDMKGLYADPSKRDVIGSLVRSYYDSLVGANGGAFTPEQSEAVEPPTSLVWTLYFLAQHECALGRHESALDLLEKAIAHTPTLPELHLAKARVLKRAGADPKEAVKAIELARSLDGQDRFLNSKSVKYHLRADLNDEAESLAGLFTKADAESPSADLIEMQALWYVVEDADAYVRRGELAMATKRYWQIFQIFKDIEDDQFDFHQYCVRKGTFRAYVNMMRYMDTLRSHPKYIRAAQAAVPILLKVHADPSILKPPQEKETEAERQRREQAEARERAKAEAKAKKQAALDAQKKKSGAKKGKGGEEQQPEEEAAKPIPDPDPKGEKLVRDEPLKRALDFVRPLEREAPRHVATWTLSFDVALARKKYLQALRAIQTAASLDSAHPGVHERVARLAALVPTLSSLPEQVSAAVKDGVDALVPSSLEAYLSDYLQRHASKSVAHTVGAARALHAVRGAAAARDEVQSLLAGAIRDADVSSPCTLPAVKDAIALANEIGADAKSLQEAGQAHFPRAFGGTPPPPPSSDESKVEVVD